MNNRTLLFLHIPKTAGMSFVNMFERITDEYERYEIYEFSRVINLRDMSSKSKANLRIIYGHFHFGLHEILSQETEYFTFLRDPVDRIVSDYYHVRRHPNSAIHHIAAKGTLLDFAKYRVYEQGLTNRMTRQISGYYGIEEEWPNADTVTYKPLPEEALEIANSNLERYFGLVGITSYFDETMLLLKQQWGWPTVHYVSRNVGTNRIGSDNREVTTDFLEFVKEHNSLDVQVYELWFQRFQRRMEQQGQHFQQTIQRYRQINRIYSSIMTNRTAKRVYRHMPKQVRRFL